MKHVGGRNVKLTGSLKKKKLLMLQFGECGKNPFKLSSIFLLSSILVMNRGTAARMMLQYLEDPARSSKRGLAWKRNL